ncbi:RICIN domain-containing protein [Nonomuraea sp. NPDC049695]|uniref:RICIN domain-containing protein n=1 Tax=Nonomuraea sp. NPDC049695 TaxID=3154734 RepID=UPI003433ED75
MFRVLSRFVLGTLLALSIISTPASYAAGSPIAMINRSTGKCADLPNLGANPAGTPVTQFSCNSSDGDNQLWIPRPTRVVNGVQLYEFLNVKSSLCLDLPGFGYTPSATRLSIYYCASTPADDNQEWYLRDVVEPHVDQLVINYKNGLCLDVAGWASTGSDRADNLPLTVFTCYDPSWANDGYDDHRWLLMA